VEPAPLLIAPSGSSPPKVLAASSSIGVRIEPGAMQLQRMFSSAWSRATVVVKLTTPPFEAE
jgi:hypothetical protein